ncbi:MAG: hypothetical protein AB1465_03480 [Patescibacteria group bacterium]
MDNTDERPYCRMNNIKMGINEEKVRIETRIKNRKQVFYVQLEGFVIFCMTRLRKRNLLEIPGMQRVNNGNGIRYIFDFAKFLKRADKEDKKAMCQMLRL